MKNKKSGFTMIELLVVIIIIGVIAGAAQVRFQGSYNRNLTARGGFIAYTLMKMAKHLSVIENRDYIYCAYSEGENHAQGPQPGSSLWRTSIVTLAKSKDPFTPEDNGDYESFSLASGSASYTEVITFKMPLPEGATIEAGPTNPPRGSGTLSDPYRTIFKYYGTCNDNNGRYFVCSNALRISGTNFSDPKYKSNFFTVLADGGNFSGAPSLIEYGYWGYSS
ncbi:prepilin-type N-terminal cleavage/methylation domain-containing protein [Candidatus Gracilibacteria bacterium]|nr:prepilin-type N-terminal cleavage/methylation domain-containing protein [Candidatus Gracilibacteria bacterium]